MKKCDCWYRETYEKWDVWRQLHLPAERHVCNGTKEREECSCGGDESKCDFYPEKRKGRCDAYERRDNICTHREGPLACQTEGDMLKCPYITTMIDKPQAIGAEESSRENKTMNTAEMWIEAQTTGAYYECTNGDVAYSKELGLVEKNDHKRVCNLAKWDISYPEKAFDTLLGCCKWKRMETPIPLAEAEVLLGRRILVTE